MVLRLVFYLQCWVIVGRGEGWVQGVLKFGLLVCYSWCLVVTRWVGSGMGVVEEVGEVLFLDLYSVKS